MWANQEMRADMSGSTQKTAVSTGRSPCASRKGLPMSERQQLALVMQMCASDKSASSKLYDYTKLKFIISL